MDWIVLSHKPGFGSDLTSWTISLKKDGQLNQHIVYCRSGRAGFRDPSEVQLEAKLPDSTVKEIEEVVTRIDFILIRTIELLTAGVDDRPQQTVQILIEGVVIAVSGCFHEWRKRARFSKTKAENVERLIGLWNLINRVSPRSFEY